MDWKKDWLARSLDLGSLDFFMGASDDNNSKNLSFSLALSCEWIASEMFIGCALALPNSVGILNTC